MIEKMSYSKYISRFLTIIPNTSNTSIQLINRIDNFIKRNLIEDKLIEISKDHNLEKHISGVAEYSLQIYKNKIGSDFQSSIFFEALLVQYFAGLFHDLGKLELNFPDPINRHDSVNIENLLRSSDLDCIANSVRHNPFLFLSDYHNNKVSLTQYITVLSDLEIGSQGIRIRPYERLTKMIKKDIDINFQYEFILFVYSLFDKFISSKSIPPFLSDNHREQDIEALMSLNTQINLLEDRNEYSY